MTTSIATSQTILVVGGGISVMLMTEVAGITGTRGKYSVKLNVAPHHVKE